MRCDRAISLLATGGVLGRWLARRHASHCPSCAAESVRLRRIADELSAVEPLSAAQRALWTSLSTEPRPSESRPARYRPALLAGSAAAVVVGLGIGVAIVARRPSPGPGPGPPVAVPDRPVAVRLGDRPETSPEMIRDLDDLKAHLQALSQDLVQLRRRAELLDERRDAEVLSRRFDRSIASRDPLGTPLTLTWDAGSLPAGLGDRGIETAPPGTPVESGSWGGHPPGDGT